MTTGRAALERIVFCGIALLAMAGVAAAQPVVNLIANAAADSVATGNVARGELISIYGTNLSTSLGANFTPTSPVLSLGGASVMIGGIAAPITYASPTQLDVQVPFEIADGVPSVNITVTAAGATSAPYMLNVVAADLGMAYCQVGTQIFNVTQANTAIVTATSGSVVAIVAFGIGSVTPAVASGVVTPSGTFNALVTPTVTMNGASVHVSSAVLANGSVGVYVVSVTVPAGASGPITVVLGGVAASSQVGGIATDPVNGDVFAVNSAANTVKVFNSRGDFKFQFGTTGAGPGQFRNPTAIAIHSNGDIVVYDAGNSRIEVFDPNGTFKFQFHD
ncbi:MAG: 6-bladed beta-propeller [Candidatus Binataceae bacterium]